MLAIYLAALDTEEERSVFRMLYQEHRDLMFSVALKILGSQADAEAAVGDAFESVLGLLGTIDAPKSQKSRNLMVLITKNKCYDLLRKRRGITEERLEEAEEKVAAPQGGFSNELAAAIAAMSPQGRTMVTLHYYHGYSVREIAKMLGISRDAARKRLERTHKELRRILEEE